VNVTKGELIEGAEVSIELPLATGSSSPAA
jgi:hypothetical protein